jgi:hypothetical protein
VLERFPGAKVIHVSAPAAPSAAPPPPSGVGDDEVAYNDAHDDNDEL